MVRALRAVWEAAGYPWARRLTALLPVWLPWARKRLALSPATEAKLGAISARQMDRVLASGKRTIRRRLYGRTKPGTLLKHHIPIKTDHWDVTAPGFTEVDLVSHSGDRAAGEFLQSLDLTDIHTTWVETCAVMGKSQIRVQEGRARRVGPAAQRESHPAGGARHLKNSRGLLREAEPVRFRFIDVEKARRTVTILCRCLAVTRSGFYAWQGRAESPRSEGDRQLKVLVKASFDASKQRYGSPRIHGDLIELRERVSRKRVVRVMQEEGLVARARKQYKSTTMSDHDHPVAANLLAQRFDAEAPNQRWVGDTTELVIGGSQRLFLAAVLDLFS